ncbi:MAG: ROK family transcriptional regulator [Phycisphaerales bacterium]|nr:ROK family transcriptional regulator [Phycisphaerales bacterium]
MPKLMTGKPRLNREVNRRLILERIRRNGVTSRAELAKITAIRPPTVSAVIRELIDEGLVEETGNGTPNGGRAPRMVALRRDKPQALGFEVTDKAIRAGLCDLNGAIYSEASVDFAPTTPDATVARLHEVGKELVASAGMTWKGLQGIGVAVPGHLRAKAGIVRWSQPFAWRDVPLRDICQKRWGTHTDVINDSIAGGMAAHFLGSGVGCRNLVYLHLRFLDEVHGVVGIGTGIILNGEAFHGEFGAAGEITTPVTHPLIHARDRKGKPFADVRSLIAAIRVGDTAACAAIARVTDELSPLVLHIVNLLEPGKLVIGSDVEALREEMVARLRDVVQKHRLSYEAGETQILASSLGDFGVVRGAVVPTLQRMFRMPQWT